MDRSVANAAVCAWLSLLLSAVLVAAALRVGS